MKNFKGKLAVITGAGTGMGRGLARQLAAEGCHLAMCDVQMEMLDETKTLCEKDALSNTCITTHQCDVSDEGQVMAFCDAVKHQHDTRHINLLFNNAGIGGGGQLYPGRPG
ncbi:MAG: SDR family NAD(P)-dependent oxidoreductase [Deltaproteobacteria bacterium]